MKNVILQQVKQYKGAFLAAPILLIISGLLETVIPMMTTHIVDDGISQNNISEVLRWGGYMLIFAVGALITALIGYVYSAKASSGLAANLREALFVRIQSFSFANLDKYGVSSLVTRQTTDVTNIQTAAQTILNTFFKTPVAIIYSLILTVQGWDRVMVDSKVSPILHIPTKIFWSFVVIGGISMALHFIEICIVYFFGGKEAEK